MPTYKIYNIEWDTSLYLEENPFTPIEQLKLPKDLSLNVPKQHNGNRKAAQYIQDYLNFEYAMDLRGFSFQKEEKLSEILEKHNEFS